MTKPKARRAKRGKRGLPLPDNDLERYRAGCRRWLAGHGPRKAEDLLASVPTDLGIDRYGEGGAVTAIRGR